MATEPLTLDQAEIDTQWVWFSEDESNAVLGHVDVDEFNRRLHTRDHATEGFPLYHVTEVTHVWVVIDRHQDDCEWPDDSPAPDCECAYLWHNGDGGAPYYLNRAEPTAPHAVPITEAWSHLTSVIWPDPTPEQCDGCGQILKEMALVDRS